MKWSNLTRTLNLPGHDSESSDEEHMPVLDHEYVPHKGAVNRLKAMHGSPIVATWNDENEVAIYDIKGALTKLENR
jgi:hypothetical protein